MRKIKSILVFLITLTAMSKFAYMYFDSKIVKGDEIFTQNELEIFHYRTHDNCSVDNTIYHVNVDEDPIERLRKEIKNDKELIIKKGKEELTLSLLEIPKHKNPNFFLEENVAVIYDDFKFAGVNYIGALEGFDTIEEIIVKSPYSKTLYKVIGVEELTCGDFSKPMFDSQRKMSEIINSNEDLILLQMGDKLFKAYKSKAS